MVLKGLKLKEIASALLEIFVPKNCPKHIFLLHTKLQIYYVSRIKITHVLISFKFGTLINIMLIKVYISLKF